MLARLLNAVFLAPPVRWLLPTPEIEDRRDPEAFLARRLPAASARVAALRPAITMAGRDVADVGCGLGDKTVAAAAAGARDVVGIDLDPEKLVRARTMARHASVGGTRFAVGSAVRLPLADDSRDVVLLLETIEHVAEPAAVLAECRRVLRPGGRIVVTFPPYRSPWGAHLFQHVAIPWVHMLLPEREILELWRGLHRSATARTGSWVTPSQARRIDSAGTIDQLWSLNEMTVATFLGHCAQSGLSMIELELKTIRGLAGPLLASPRLREYVVTHVTAIMELPCV